MYLLMFLAGVCFSIFFHPIISTLAEVIMTWLESLKGKISLKIAQYSKEIQEIQEDMVPTQTHTIGFPIDEEGVYEDDDD